MRHLGDEHYERARPDAHCGRHERARPRSHAGKQSIFGAIEGAKRTDLHSAAPECAGLWVTGSPLLAVCPGTGAVSTGPENLLKVLPMSDELKKEFIFVLKNGISFSEQREEYVIAQSVFDWVEAHMAKKQLCPKCLGEAVISAYGTTTSPFRICPVCNGARLI